MQADARRYFRFSMLIGLLCAAGSALLINPVIGLLPVVLSIVACGLVFHHPLEDIGATEELGRLDHAIFGIGALLVIISGAWASLFNSHEGFFALTVLVLSLSVILIRWTGGLSLYLLTGLLGSVFAFQSGDLVVSVIGVPWFLSVFLISALWHLDDGFDPSMDSDDLSESLALVLAAGLGLVLPLWIGGTLLPSVQPEWLTGTIEPSQVSSESGSPSTLVTAIKGVLLVVIGGGLVVGLYWILRKLREEEAGEVQEIQMPVEEEMDVGKVDRSTADNLQQVVRGGRGADILKWIHGLLSQREGTDRERKHGETIDRFLRRDAALEPLSSAEKDFLVEIYTMVRYGEREPAKDDHRHFQTLMERCELT